MDSSLVRNISAHARLYFSHRLGVPVGRVVFKHQPYSEITLDRFVAGVIVYAPDGTPLRVYNADTGMLGDGDPHEQLNRVLAAMLAWREPCASTVFWPDQEACEAECILPKGHEPATKHEDEILGEWDEDELSTSHG